MAANPIPNTPECRLFFGAAVDEFAALLVAVNLKISLAQLLLHELIEFFRGNR
jgi:hypothetical protein